MHSSLSFSFLHTNTVSHLSLFIFPCFLLSWMQRNSIITPPPPSCRYGLPTSKPATSAKTTCCPKRTLCLQRRARVGTRQRHWLSPADHRLSSLGQQLSSQLKRRIFFYCFMILCVTNFICLVRGSLTGNILIIKVFS